MIHRLGGLAAGLIVAMLTMIVVEGAGNQLHGSGLNADASATLPVTEQPVTLLIFVIAGWFLGGFLGSAVALRVSRTRWMVWPIAAAILVGVFLMFAWAPHPSWMFIAGPLAPLLGAGLAQLIVKPHHAIRTNVEKDAPGS